MPQVLCAGAAVQSPTSQNPHAHCSNLTLWKLLLSGLTAHWALSKWSPTQCPEGLEKNRNDICRLSGKLRRLNRDPKAVIGEVWGGSSPPASCEGLRERRLTNIWEWRNNKKVASHRLQNGFDHFQLDSLQKTPHMNLNMSPTCFAGTRARKLRLETRSAEIYKLLINRPGGRYIYAIFGIYRCVSKKPQKYLLVNQWF